MRWNELKLQRTGALISRLSERGYVICNNMNERAWVARCLDAMEIPYEEDCEEGPLDGSKISLKEGS